MALPSRHSFGRARFGVRDDRAHVHSSLKKKGPVRISPAGPFDFGCWISDIGLDLGFRNPRSAIRNQYIPPIPPGPPGPPAASFFSSGISEMSASVVSSRLAIDEEF